MVEVVIRHDSVVLDACCIINIAATGEFENILETLPTQFVVSSYVSKFEVLSYIDENGSEIPISLDVMIKKKLILEANIDYSNEEESNYIIALEAEKLDRGEAESAALAINRKWAIATDDRRAVKVIGRLSPKTQILTTPELVKYWVDRIEISENRIKQVIKSIRRYVPPKDHPLVEWWQKYI